jgi:hypothetical protein
VVVGNKVTSYNGVTTASNGTAATEAVTQQTGKTSVISGAALYTPGATGRFIVSWTAKITTAATTSSTLGGTGGFSVTYTDPNDSTTPTSYSPCANSGGNNTATACGGSFMIYASAAAITYSFGYTSSPASTMTYEIYVAIQQI